MTRSSSRRGRRRFGRRPPEAVGSASWLIVDDEYGDAIVQAPPPVTEQLRYIVERLRLKDADDLPTRIGVTSAVSGEGVPLVARTLAGVLAGDADRTVCLVSLDWWTTGEHPVDRPGVAQIVTGEAETNLVILDTSLPQLKHVPAGWADPGDLPALVRSTVLANMLRELALRFHHVVLELPPIHVTSEALALAGHCDACALVVLQGVTSHNDVQMAIDSLGDERLLGVVMNQASSRVPDFILRAVAPA